MGEAYDEVKRANEIMINEIRSRAEAIIQSGEKYANEGKTLITELEQLIKRR
jgi:hypothetical protein